MSQLIHWHNFGCAHQTVTVQLPFNTEQTEKSLKRFASIKEIKWEGMNSTTSSTKLNSTPCGLYHLIAYNYYTSLEMELNWS